MHPGTLIHYGSTRYQPELVKLIFNEGGPWSKPYGGLWVSPINSSWGWKQWNLDSGFRACEETNSFKLELRLNSDICIINSLEDLLKLPQRNVHVGYPMKMLNFEVLMEKYDAIWLTEKGQYETHFSEPLNLYGWDCESLLIMNPDCCYQVW